MLIGYKPLGVNGSKANSGSWSTHAALLLLLSVTCTLYLFDRFGALAFEPKHAFASVGVAETSFIATQNQSRCTSDWIVREQLTQRVDFVENFKDLHSSSGCPVFPVDDQVLFHLLWDGDWRPFLDGAIESFLATQNLENGKSKLIIWHLTTAPTQHVISKYQADVFAGYVEFRHFSFQYAASGTCLEYKFEWQKLSQGLDTGLSQMLISDMIRIALLYRLGGVWIDADVWLLRDLRPLLAAGPMVGHSGALKDWYNGHFLYAGPRGSATGHRMLQILCQISSDIEKWQFPNAMPLHKDFIYGDGLFQVCEHYNHCGLSPHPMYFLDDELKPPTLDRCNPVDWISAADPTPDEKFVDLASSPGRSG